MADQAKSIVASEEDVARILSNGWVKDGVVQHTAFALREGETYISVNRPAVASYPMDVAAFVKTHKNFHHTDNGISSYQRALLHVNDVRNISVEVDNKPLAVDVEVEPRDVFTKSHAGIFTRHEGNNLKTGGIIAVSEQKEIPADVVLLKVRLALVRLSKVETVETCFI